jgi:hypothetical protein
MVSGTVHYKILSERRDQLEHMKAENDSRIGRLDVTIRELQSSRTHFEEETRVGYFTLVFLLVHFIFVRLLRNK